MVPSQRPLMRRPCQCWKAADCGVPASIFAKKTVALFCSSASKDISIWRSSFCHWLLIGCYKTGGSPVLSIYLKRHKNSISDKIPWNAQKCLQCNFTHPQLNQKKKVTMNKEPLVVHHTVWKNKNANARAFAGMFLFFFAPFYLWQQRVCRWKETHLEPARTNSFDISQQRRRRSPPCVSSAFICQPASW